MKIFSDIAHLFPITNPTWIFLVVLAIILATSLWVSRAVIPTGIGEEDEE